MFGIKGGNHDGQHSKCRRKSLQGREKSRKEESQEIFQYHGDGITIEIMIMGAMVLKLDFHSADRIALALGFMVLYSGVVIALADK
jgi:hypothetical protein